MQNFLCPLFPVLIGHDTLSVSPKKRSVTKGYYETSSGIDAPEGSKAASYTLTETTVNVQSGDFDTCTYTEALLTPW